MRLAVLLVVFSCLVHVSQCIRFELEQQPKCLREEVSKDVLVVGNFTVEEDPRMLLKVSG